MEVRSWMAILVIMAGSTVETSAESLGQTAATGSSSATAELSGKASAQPQAQGESAATATPRTVKLEVKIAGLGRGGCDVEVKPGNRSSRFQGQGKHIESSGEASFLIRDVEIRGADRNCTFAITVRESGQPPRTIYRAFRMAERAGAEGSRPSVPTFTCYLNSPSKLAGLGRSDKTRQ